MKQLLIFLSIFILVRPALPLIDYMVNYGYIVAELCINRDKPELECNGSCYLKDELAHASQDEIPFSENQKQASSGFQILFLQEIKPIVFLNLSEEKSSVKCHFQDLYIFEWQVTILRPPIIS